MPNDEAAEGWFAKVPWLHVTACIARGSMDGQAGPLHSALPYRCRERQLRKRFIVRYGTVADGSKLGYQVRALVIYLLLTSHKSVSSMRLHRDLEITRKSP